MLRPMRASLVLLALIGSLGCRPEAGSLGDPPGDGAGGGVAAEGAGERAASEESGAWAAHEPAAAGPEVRPDSETTPVRKAVVLPTEVKPSPLVEEIDRLSAEIEPAVIAYRRDLHRHPELGNREFRTAKVIAEHLRKHGWKVRKGVAHTGLVAVLEGGKPGAVVALRAEMDALPVKEETGLPFASKATAEWNGNKKTPVMHACGHDMHMAIVMGVAELLPRVRERLPGTVVLLFQPAEEGPPRGERGGAELMVAEGALEDPAPEVIFGLHVFPERVGEVGWRAGPAMASGDSLRITVKGKQTHAAYPWRGVDPITVSAQIVLALQTIVTRQVDTTKSASVVSIGSIQGGLRGNIIPDQVEMVGTIRTFDPEIREELHRRIDRTARSIAEAADATAEVVIDEGYPVVVNDPILTARMLPTLVRVAGAEKVKERQPVFGSEDFSFYQQEIPGLFFFLGVTPEAMKVEDAASNHSPKFIADDKALRTGVRAMANLAVDYLFAVAER
jgi:amidohydrolase